MVLGLVVTFGVVVGLVLVVVVVLAGGAGGFGVVSDVLPPPGCAKAGATNSVQQTTSE